MARPRIRAARPRRRAPRWSQFTVAGLTCGQCVGRLMDALLNAPGVSSVTVSPHYGAPSVVTVASTTALDVAALRAAVTSAGFAATSRHNSSEPGGSRNQDRP